jgi:hypothetical protein
MDPIDLPKPPQSSPQDHISPAEPDVPRRIRTEYELTGKIKNISEEDDPPKSTNLPG